MSFAGVGADGGYGKEPGFLRALQAMGEVLVADVHKDQRIYLEDPQPHLLICEAAAALGLVGATDQGRCAIVITHDCDLPHDSELCVEVIVAALVVKDPKPDPPLFYAKALAIANGFACRQQIRGHRGREPRHLAEVLRRALPPERSQAPGHGARGQAGMPGRLTRAPRAMHFCRLPIALLGLTLATTALGRRHP